MANYPEWKLAIRTLRRSPGLTAMAVSILAVGMGGSITMFTLVDALLFRSLPYPHSDRLVAIWTRQAGNAERILATPADFNDWREQARSFTFLSAYAAEAVTLHSPDRPVTVPGGRVSPEFFTMLGWQARLGRTFVAADAKPGQNRVVVISDGIWKDEFGGAAGILGRSIQLDGQPHTVVGVMPADFRYARSRLWVPLTSDENILSRDYHAYDVTGRLRPGAVVAQARAEMSAIAARLASSYPKTNKDWTAEVAP